MRAWGIGIPATRRSLALKVGRQRYWTSSSGREFGRRCAYTRRRVGTIAINCVALARRLAAARRGPPPRRRYVGLGRREALHRPPQSPLRRWPPAAPPPPASSGCRASASVCRRAPGDRCAVLLFIVAFSLVRCRCLAVLFAVWLCCSRELHGTAASRGAWFAVATHRRLGARCETALPRRSVDGERLRVTR